MLYAVIACEQMYDGMHGMVSYFVVEGTEKDAEEAAIEASYEVMQEYSCIMDDLNAMAEEAIDFDFDEESDEIEGGSEEWDEAYSYALGETMRENTQYEIYPIVKETNLSLEQLDNLFYRNPEAFIREYCNLPGFSNGYR